MTTSVPCWSLGMGGVRRCEDLCSAVFGVVEVVLAGLESLGPDAGRQAGRVQAQQTIYNVL